MAILLVIYIQSIYPKVFIQKQAGIYADFSYAIPISYNSRLIGGIKFGGDFYNIDGSDTLAFVVLSAAQWGRLEEEFG
ncbi:MAG: hypothetical protein ACFNS5_09290, partial [Prevotella melaninogenica]